MSAAPAFEILSRRRPLLVALAVSAVVLGGATTYFWDRLPAVRWGGVASLSEGPPLAHTLRPIALAPGATILCEGDSLTYGAERVTHGGPPINGGGSDRVSAPYPETLAAALGGKVRVENHGFPGDKAADGLRRWNTDGPADVVILMYGTNDADPRGRGTGVSVADYSSALERLVRRHADRGATVIVLAPPPAGILSSERAIAPYRAAARAVAQRSGALFADPRSFLGTVSAPLQLDGIHLRSDAYRAIAAGLAGLFTIKADR